MQTQTEKVTIEKEMPMPDLVSDAVKVAVMNSELQHLNATMVRVEGKFDKAIENFATNERIDALVKAADEKHKDQDDAIKKLEDQNTWIIRTVGTLLIAAIVGGVLIAR